ncbi:zinc-dependent metalloprotease [Viscerimonas tarda]
MKKINLCILLLCMCSLSHTQSANLFKKAVGNAVEKSKTDSVANPKAKYKDIVKDANTKKGLFTTHLTKKNKLYFELSDSAMTHTYLLTNRIASTSNTHDFVAGQMATKPLVIRFSRDSTNVYMHNVQTENEVEEGSPIASAFKKNFFDPVLKGFPIEAENGGNVLIDVTAFFGENEKCISPIKPDNPLSKLLGGSSTLKGTFVSGASGIQETKTFKKNIEIRSMLSYTTTPLNEPYTVIVNRSVVLLPDTLMTMRLQDNRVGFFNSDRNLYTTEQDKVYPYIFIHRWKLEPKPGQREAYFRGELVEPAKPIVFYVDSAFPEKWAKSIRQGIEDWNTAFEQAGFKNAIAAKDYPKNDPDFDPDDMRYSCFKYATTPTANAMGPSHIDPRSGEILNADVIWYHNILSLLHHWRFTQTASTDPRVRKPVFDDEVMQESMRYVASHEIGHTLGLMHNMGGSYAFPVDSLRSPSFTQKYGTTPSIMDYARNNFIAQPGDFEKGVKLTPPVLGVYDIYAINWGYRIIPGAKTPLDEKKTLTAWIEEKKNDPMYEFGAQQFLGTIDPTDQTEDLGNDHIKAGDLAISNLKIVARNLEKWTLEAGERYDNVETAYQEVVKQYARYIRHVLPYLGGVEFKEIRQGENPAGAAKKQITKTEQQRAIKWLLEQMRSYNSWLTPPELLSKIEIDLEANSRLQTSVVNGMFNASVLYRISEGEKLDPVNNYTLDGYLNDVIAEVFKTSYQNRPLNADEITIQSAAISQLINGSSLRKQEARAQVTAFDDLLTSASEQSLPCCYSDLEDPDRHSFLRINFGLPSLPGIQLNPLMAAQLKKVLALYKQRRATTADATSRNFYDYHILTIDKLFKE